MKLLNLEMEEKAQSSNEENNNLIDNKDKYKKMDKIGKNFEIRKKESEEFHNTEKSLSSSDSLSEIENMLSEMEINKSQIKKEKINSEN